MSKKKIVDSPSCGYFNSDDCPYSDSDACSYSNETCAVREEKRKRTNSFWKQRVGVIALILSCVAIVILEHLKLRPCTAQNDSLKDIYNLLIGGCFSVIAASLIALFIDVPSYLQQYERHFANMLSSNTYLKILDSERLNQLRRDVTSQIHKTEVPNLPDGLVRMDEEVCNLFNKPYYERYSHLVQCKMMEGTPKTIKKEHFVEYKLINPGFPNSEAVEMIKISNLIIQRTEEDKGITDFKLSVQADDGEEIKLPKEYDMIVEPLDNKIEFYTAKVFLAKKDDNGGCLEEGFRANFKASLKVKYSYTIEVAANDRCFTKRLQHPAKLFIMNYSCSDDDIRLHGQIIGTNLKQSNMSIQYLDDNSINMVSYDWLLPDNGAIVVMLDKKPKKECE